MVLEGCLPEAQVRRIGGLVCRSPHRAYRSQVLRVLHVALQRKLLNSPSALFFAALLDVDPGLLGQGHRPGRVPPDLCQARGRRVAPRKVLLPSDGSQVPIIIMV